MIEEVHAGKPLEALLRKKDKGQKLSADSAYIGAPIDEMLKKRYNSKNY
jgi:hypothetical protein